jgi:hypothetical protein
MSEAASDVRRRAAWAVLRDQSGEGVAEYSTMISLFAVQCVVGALIVSRNVDGIIQAIRSIF